MHNNPRDILKLAVKIAAARPAPDTGIEQYLMSAESMARQVLCLEETFRGKTVFFLGDDDHMSVLLAYCLGVSPVVAEIDERVRSSLARLYGELHIRHPAGIISYDAREEIPKKNSRRCVLYQPALLFKNPRQGRQALVEPR